MKKITLFVMALLMMVTTSMAATKVAYIITSSYSTYADGCSLDTDPVLNALKANFEVEVLDLPDGEEADYASIVETYKVAVLSEAMNGKGTLGIGLEKLVGMMPVVSMKAYFYTDGRWSWAAPANPSTKPTTGITVKADFRDHALFKGLEIGADGVIQLYDGTGNSNNIQGFKDLVDGSPIDLEMVYATASTDETINAVHEVVMNDYKYVLLPMSSDNIETMLPAAPQLVVNAVNYVTDGGVSVEEANKIAYLYDSSKEGYDVDSDPAYAVISGTDNIVEAIDIKDFTAESTDTINALESNYDLVVVSEGPGSAHKFASSLLGMVNRVPMLNMKSFFYKKDVWNWGAGSNPKPATGTIVLTEAGAAHPVFETLGYGAGDEVELYIAPEEYTGNMIQGYTVSEGSLIANDAVLATIADGINAIHEHGKNNTYMLYPFSSDAAIAGIEFTDDATNLLLAIVDYLADTKSKVRQASKPEIEVAYNNASTTVTITSLIEGATIHYTVDGTEPTSASPVYSDDLVFTQACVVKAIVSATGYNDSEVASAEVVIKSKLSIPTISVTRNADNSVITLAGAVEGTSIYFNFTGSDDATISQVYVDTIPVVLTEPATVYAFVSGGDYINSDLVSEYVGINSLTAETIRLDTLAHFDANPTDWFLNDTENGGSGEAKAYYFNGKKSWNYYSTEIIGTEPVLGEDGVQLKTEDGRDSVKNIYSPDPAALKVFNPLNENGWVIKSAGQVLTLEGNLDAQAGVGNGATGRYAETAIDAIGGAPTKGCITFGGKTSGDPYTASIETTGAYAGPFDVLVAVGNGNGSGKGILEIQTSVDGATWATLDTLNLADTQRYYKRTRVAYNETASVYVRLAQTGGGSKAQVYDILLLNNGELSKQYTEQGSGIELPSVTGAEVVGVQIYNASGIQQRELGRGLNIVRQLYSDGSVKVLKIMGK